MLLTQPRITIDLNAIRDNYLALKKQASDIEVCPMMKGYGYGLGLVEVVRPLVESGCQAVYVSFINEGILLRKAFPKLQINVVNGIFEGTGGLFLEHRLTPVLNSLQQLERWESIASSASTGAIIQVETGMHRLGILEDEWGQLTPERLKRDRVSLMMTHFACAQEAEQCAEPQRMPIVRDQNRRQFEAYRRALEYFRLPGSVVIDAYMIRPNNEPMAQMRTGCAILFGIVGFSNEHPFLKGLHLSPAVTVQAPIAQIETLRIGDRVGYGGTYEAKKETKIAIVAMGFSHGLPKSLSNRGNMWFSDGAKWHAAPIVGKVSMDLTVCDVTNVPQAALDQGLASPLNEHYTLNEMLMDSGRSRSEISCSFARMEWVYKE